MKFRMIFAAAVLALGTTAMATTLKENTQEFRVEGEFNPETANGTDFQVGLTYGLFVADNIEIGGHITYHDNNSSSLFSAGPFAELNFDIGGEMVPFLGLSVDYAHGDAGAENHDALAFTGYGGVKYFLSENVAIQARLALDLATDKIYAKSNKAESTDITVDLGMSFYIP